MIGGSGCCQSSEDESGWRGTNGLHAVPLEEGKDGGD
jgi:hypothetical protein